MKQLVFVFMALLLGVGTITAQKEADKSVRNYYDYNYLRIGVDAGVGLNSVSASNVQQPLQLNQSAGVYINYCGAGFILVESGLRWNRRQFNLNNFNSEYTKTVNRLDVSVNNLEVPILLGGLIKINRDRSKPDIRLAVKLGMYFAVGLNGSGSLYGTNDAGGAFESHIDNVFENQKMEYGDYDKFKRFDMGGKIGFDVYFDRFKIGFMYTRGWLDMNKTYDRHIKTKSFDFTVGYTFKLSKKEMPIKTKK